MREFHIVEGRSTPPRRGSALVVTLVCLAVSMALVMAMFRGAFVARRGLLAERDLRQVEHLLDAGIAWALPRIAAGGVAGTTLTLAPDEIVGQGSARIAFDIEARDGAPRLRVVVDYPLEGPVPIRRSRELVLSPARVNTPEENLP